MINIHAKQQLSMTLHAQRGHSRRASWKPPAPPSTVPRPLPDWADVHREMKARKKTKVTLQVVVQEGGQGT